MSTGTRNFILTLCALFALATGIAVGIPYYKQRPDKLKRQETYEHVRSIADALDRFARRNSEGRYPTNLDSVLGDSSSTQINNFIYTGGGTRRASTPKQRVPLLIEKPGHYKYSPGGFVAYSDGYVVFLWASEYDDLVSSSGGK
jgi:hypothetical protein